MKFFLEMQLRPHKLTYRYSEPSFFLTNKTSTLCGEEIGQMKPMLRFSLMNFFGASCLDTEGEYIGPTKG